MKPVLYCLGLLFLIVITACSNPQTERTCLQVFTTGYNPDTKECISNPNSCLPEGYIKYDSNKGHMCDCDISDFCPPRFADSEFQILVYNSKDTPIEIEITNEGTATFDGEQLVTKLRVPEFETGHAGFIVEVVYLPYPNGKLTATVIGEGDSYTLDIDKSKGKYIEIDYLTPGRIKIDPTDKLRIYQNLIEDLPD